MQKTFWVYVDKEGKCPILHHAPLNFPSHPFYVKYVNDRPVSFRGPREIVCSDVTRTKVWDYLDSKYVSIDNLAEE